MKTILIPMAGAGSRFADAGYTLSKPLIPVYSAVLKRNVEMIVAAAHDAERLMGKDVHFVFVMRDFHIDAGVDKTLKQEFKSVDIVVLDHLTEGQAATCLVARDFLDPNAELLIGACDCGFLHEAKDFESVKQTHDAVIITHSNDDNIKSNPTAHSWLALNEDDKTLKQMSIKKTVSETFEKDHATTGIFWFKTAADFLNATDEMIQKKDKVNNEYYVDRVPDYLVQENKKVTFFDVDYLSWGTPQDYELYQDSIAYWSLFKQQLKEKQ